MENNKLVSVIIPTFKGSDVVSNAVTSVLNQDYINVEVLVVDDNGEGSDEQIKTFHALNHFQGDSRFHYIIHKENKNGAAARNTGFFSSRGEYICFLDDDDTYMPFKVSIQVEELNRLDCSFGMVYCLTEKRLNNQLVSITKYKKSGDLLLSLLLHDVVIGSNTFMLRREIYEKLNGFDESFKRHQDFEFTARVAAICKIKVIRKPASIHNLIGRNDPNSFEQAIRYRQHYIDKMMIYIDRYGRNKKKYIIYTNFTSLMVPMLKKGSIVKMFLLCKKYTSEWIEKHSVSLFLLSIFTILKRLFVKKIFNC